MQTNAYLQSMVSLPRASAFDPRIAKTGEAPRTQGDDGKLYVKVDSRDQNRFHVLTDEQVEDEKRRNDSIKAVLAKPTGRSRSLSASLGPTSRPSAPHAARATTGKPSPGRPPRGPRRSVDGTNNFTSTSGSSNDNVDRCSSSRNGESGVQTAAAATSIHTEIAYPEDMTLDPASPTDAMGTLKAEYEDNLDIIDQLYKEKRSLENRVRSLEFQASHPHSRAMIPGAEDLRKSSQSAPWTSSSRARSPSTAASGGGGNGRGRSNSADSARRSGDFRPGTIVVVDALHLKNDQNRSVIDRLAAEKRKLESRVHHLEKQILHPETASKERGARFPWEGYDFDVDQAGEPVPRSLMRPQSAPSSPVHLKRAPTRTCHSASADVGSTAEDPEGLHWEIHVDPSTAEVYYYNSKTGRIQVVAKEQERNQGDGPIARSSSAGKEQPKVFEISSQLQVDVLRFKQRQIEMKMREDKLRLKQKKHEDFVSYRYLKASQLPPKPKDVPGFEGMKEREDLAAIRTQEKSQRAKVKTDGLRLVAEAKEAQEKVRLQALVKSELDPTLTWLEIEVKDRHEREARVALRCEELRALAAGFEPSSGSEGPYRRRNMEKFFPNFSDDYLEWRSIEEQERLEREQLVQARREEERLELEARVAARAAKGSEVPSTGSKARSTSPRATSVSPGASPGRDREGKPRAASASASVRSRPQSRTRSGVEDPSQVVANLDRRRKAWEETERRNKEKRKQADALRREAAAKLCTATTKKEQGKIFHGTESMVNRAIKAERKRADKEREKAEKARETIRQKLEHDMRVTEKLRNAKPPEDGRKLSAHRADMNRLRVLDNERLARLELLVHPPKRDNLKKEEEKARVERENYLMLLNKIASGQTLTAQEKRMAQLYDKRQQEVEAKAKEQRALQQKRLAEKQHGEMLRGIIAEREADRREKIGEFVEIASAVAQRSESMKMDQKVRSLKLKRGIEQKICSRPSLILRHEMDPEGYRYCACAKCKAAHKRAHSRAAEGDGESEGKDKEKDDFDEPIVTQRSSAAPVSGRSMAGVLAKLSIDEDEVYDRSQQITVRDPVDGRLGGADEQKEPLERSERSDSTPLAPASRPPDGDSASAPLASDDTAGSPTAGAPSGTSARSGGGNGGGSGGGSGAGVSTGEGRRAGTVEALNVTTTTATATGDDYDGDDFEPDQPEPEPEPEK